MIVFKKSSHLPRKQWNLPLNPSAVFRPASALLPRCRKYNIRRIREFMNGSWTVGPLWIDVHLTFCYHSCHARHRLLWSNRQMYVCPWPSKFETCLEKVHSKSHKWTSAPEIQDSPWISSAITSALLPRIIRETLGTWPAPKPLESWHDDLTCKTKSLTLRACKCGYASYITCVWMI